MAKGISKPKKISEVRFAENVQNRMDSYTKMGKYDGKKKKFGNNKVSSVGEDNAGKLATTHAKAAKQANLRINRRSQENLK